MARRKKQGFTLAFALLLLIGCMGCSNSYSAPQNELEIPQNPAAQTQTPIEAGKAEASEPQQAGKDPEASDVIEKKLSAAEKAIFNLPTVILSTVEAARLTAAEVELVSPNQADTPVVFIADGGSGDGSSPDSPLRLEASGNVFPDGNSSTNYYDSLLYQAAAKLYGTGGTIVLVGEVLCDGNDGLGEKEQRELRLPHLGGAGITVTSVWGGIDYRETNGARLIMQSPVCLALNNPVTFRNVDICTQAGGGYAVSGRIIAASGFPLVMDTGVRCIPLDEQGNAQKEPSVDAYPVIVGGHSFSSLEGCTDVTLRSGTYYTVTGGCLGIGIGGYGDLFGSSRVTVEGDAKIYGTLSAASPDQRALQDGDATLLIRGGEINNKVQICGNGGFSGPNCTGTVIITGGSFSESVKIMAKSGSYFGSKPGNIVLDYSAYNGKSDILSKAVGFSQIAGRQADISSAEVAHEPYRTTYFTDDLLDLNGLSLSLVYGEAEKKLDYQKCISGFAFLLADGTQIDPDTFRLTQDVSSLQVLYDGIKVGEFALNVLRRPAVTIVGTGILKDSEKQELGFLFGIEEGTCPDIEIKTVGVRVLPTDLLETPAELTRESLAGQEELLCTDVPTGLITTCEDLSDLLYASVREIPVEEYCTEYTAAAYYTFVCNDAVYTAYSLPCTASVYSVAKQTDSTSNVIALVENHGVSSIDEEQISKKVEEMISYFESMATLAWKAPEDINFAGSSIVTDALQYTKGKTYYGLPYIGGYNGMDNLENFCGQLDKDGTYTGSCTWNAMHGNNCTSAIFQSISRITNNYDYWSRVNDPLLNIIPKMKNDKAPYVVVGDYKIKPTSAVSEIIVKDNEDPWVIYESYAKAKRGDFLFSHWSDGSALLSHLRLITGVFVERKEDGTIDPVSSYLTVHEQTSTMDQEKASSWNLDKRAELYKSDQKRLSADKRCSFRNWIF